MARPREMTRYNWKTADGEERSTHAHSKASLEERLGREMTEAEYLLKIGIPADALDVVEVPE